MLIANNGVALGLSAVVSAIAAGAIVFGIGKVLDVLAAILLEVWEQGGD